MLIYNIFFTYLNSHINKFVYYICYLYLARYGVVETRIRKRREAYRKAEKGQRSIVPINLQATNFRLNKFLSEWAYFKEYRCLGSQITVYLQFSPQTSL